MRGIENMAEGSGTALGLSIGASNLAGVSSAHAITRKPVLTLYPERPAEVGLPSENPRLQGPGLVISGFVNRIDDPRGVVALDGSVHRSEALIADGLRALAYAATGGRPLPDNVAATYPAHWESQAVDALGAALSGNPEWSARARPILLIPDAAAALLAVRTNPGIPAHGTVAVCDFGGSGTNITLMDAGGDYQALAPTVRHRDFSGDRIDQALLSVVIANMPSTGSFPSGTAAIRSLSRLRSACRQAKEQLSSSTVSTLTDGLTGTPGEVRLTRQELDDAIRPSLRSFLAALDEVLAHNGIRDLVAVVSTGGGANIPAVTTMLSRHLRVPVATTPRPQLTAAVGAALRVAHGPGETTALLSASAAPVTAAAPTASGVPAQAWSATGRNVGATTISPAVRPTPDAGATDAGDTALPTSKRKKVFTRWRLLSTVALIGTAAAALAVVGTALAIGLTSQHNTAITPLPAPSAAPAAPGPPASGATAEPAPADVPAPPITDASPPVETEAPRATAQASPPAAVGPAHPVAPLAPRRAAAPPIPGVNGPIPGLDRVNQIIQEIEGGLGIGAFGPSR
jgi:Hsp70 protein